jgi:hypothetical protein
MEAVSAKRRIVGFDVTEPAPDRPESMLVLGRQAGLPYDRSRARPKNEQP